MREFTAEFRVNWRSLTAAMIGLGSGIGVNAYVASLFAPELVAEFGWTKADFAFIGATQIVATISAPLMGRLTDAFGTRRMVAIGVVGLPLCYVAQTVMDGSIAQYMAIMIAMHVISMATSSLVYTRLVAANFDRSRGLALAMVASAAPLGGFIMSLLLNAVIPGLGWRTGLWVMAGSTLAIGLAVLALMPAGAEPPAAPKRGGATLALYRSAFRTPAFWLITGGMLLCNINQPLHTPQLKMVLMQSGAESHAAGVMVSIYAIGVLAGRFACGFALDRLPANWVAATALGLPAVGFVILASGISNPIMLGTAVLLMAGSQGAEGDIAGYMVARHFGIASYSSILGLVFSSVAVAAAIGSAILGVSLSYSDSFAPFALLSMGASLIGCSMFLFLPKASPATFDPR